jgi:hypothetical protein
MALRRRRKAANRIVTIVETASLGPKRSLIVARVGGETLVLGSSEAGISLLRSRSTGATDIAESDAAGGGTSSNDYDRFSTGDRAGSGTEEAPGQVRFLARLFGRKENAATLQDAEPWNFDGLLEDSIEDQELRRKLSAGLQARVP